MATGGGKQPTFRTARARRTVRPLCRAFPLQFTGSFRTDSRSRQGPWVGAGEPNVLCSPNEILRTGLAISRQKKAKTTEANKTGKVNKGQPRVSV